MRSLWRVVLCLLAVHLSVAAGAWAASPLVDDNPAVFLNNLRNSSGGLLTLPPATDPDTLLYIAASGQPLRAPDGHHITLGEWIDFSGRLSMKCNNQGTHVAVHVQGLLPNALYSIFLFAQEVVPGPFIFGRLPTSLPSEPGWFFTNGQGNATVNAIMPAGPLSFIGEITDCLPRDFEAYAFNLTYQSDGMLYGGFPGPAPVAVNHAVFNLFF